MTVSRCVLLTLMRFLVKRDALATLCTSCAIKPASSTPSLAFGKADSVLQEVAEEVP